MKRFISVTLVITCVVASCFFAIIAYGAGSDQCVCSNCSGNGKIASTVTCSKCNGTGKESVNRYKDCPNCTNGYFTITKIVICSSCKGFGGTVLCKCKCGNTWYANDTGSRQCKKCGTLVSGTKIGDCGFCNGKGTRSEKQIIGCGTCRGAGEIFEGTYQTSCSYCNGTCKITQTTTCPSCNGTGKNHTGGTEIRNEISASCNSNGYTGDIYCKGCDTKIQSGSTIPSTGIHSWDNGVVTQEATTDAEGIRTYTCIVCGETKTEKIPVKESFYVIVNDAKVCPGNEFTHTFDFEGIEQIRSFGVFYDHYDDSIFEFVGGKCLSPDYVMFDASEIDRLIAAFDTPAVAGEVAEITFRVRDDVKPGDYTIAYYFVTEDSEWNNHNYVADCKVTVMSYICGDVDASGAVNFTDAIYLLRHTMRPANYPINQSGDMNGDGNVDSADAIYLLRHTMSPDKYPLA